MIHLHFLVNLEPALRVGSQPRAPGLRVLELQKQGHQASDYMYWLYRIKATLDRITIS